MGECGTPKTKSEQLDNYEGGVERRQYLSLLAASGATAIVPASNANAQSTNDGEIFRETIDLGGATATVSETGDIIAFGVYGGVTRAYVADGDEYDPVEFFLPGVSSGNAVSHVSVTEETNNIVAAVMGEDVIGGGNLDEAGGLFGTPSVDAEWAYELPGLWDIGSSADLSTVAAVSAPLDVPPHVIAVQNGEIAWEEPLDEAAAMSVDVSNDGQYIAVGGVHIDDGLERTGQPGIQVYSEEGELLWSHDTDEDVIYTGINAEANIVAVGVDDLSTLAFDLEGNLLWELDEAPSMTVLSGDGSSIIASPPVSALEANDGSVIWESGISNSNQIADPLAVSDDGTRVAVSTLDFELIVLEEGEPIWEGQNESGPYYSDISADGIMLASMEVDNDARDAELVGYRL